jgi:hypothetical protein
MGMLLHVGAKEVDYDAVRAVVTPDATHSHVPVPHHRIVDLVRHTLGYYGHEVTEEKHALTEDGMRYFGLMQLRSSSGAFEDVVALRNSHDKRFPIGLAFGGHVFVCDNLSLMADMVIVRKHTANAKRDIPYMVEEAVGPLADLRDRQAQKFFQYRAATLRPEQVDHAIMEMYRKDVVPVTKIADVWHEWDTPSFEDFAQDYTAWRLFNAVTFILNGRIVGDPRTTQHLHNIIEHVVN